jgi:hypothetical protein
LAALSQTPEEPSPPAEQPTEQAQPPAEKAPPPAKPKPRPPLDEPSPSAPRAAHPAHPAPASEGAETQLAMKTARAFFTDLIQGDARRLVGEDCGLPFYVEDRKFSGGEELLQEWLKNLRDKRTDLLTLYGIEVLTPQEMEKKYGKPPARLANVPWKLPHTLIAVANLSGHAAVVILTAEVQGWRVVGYHD